MLRGVDTSCMLKSSYSGIQVLFGPITLTNHSCVPNCEFDSSRSKIVSLRAIRDIEPGEELTIFYGENYFDKNNKGCQCSDKKGYFRKLKRGETRDRDLFTPEDDEAILKVCNLCDKCIWVVLPRTGKMSNICHFFLFFGALLWPNGLIF